MNRLTLRILYEYDTYFTKLQTQTDPIKQVFNDCFTKTGKFVYNSALNKAVKIATSDYPDLLHKYVQQHNELTKLNNQLTEMKKILSSTN